MVEFAMDRLRLGSFNKNDALSRSSPRSEECAASVGNDTQGVPWVSRCVVVHRDEKGYGLKLIGHRPVFVESVKEGGAADKAGVHEGDRIIKVNGTLVTYCDHHEVVNLIQSAGSFVRLTLGHPNLSGNSFYSPNSSNGGASSPSHISLSSTPMGLRHHPSSVMRTTSNEFITGPQPADPEQQIHCKNQTVQTICKMVEDDKKHLRSIQGKLEVCPTDELRSEEEQAKKRIAALEKQLSLIRGANESFRLDRTSSKSGHALPPSRGNPSEPKPPTTVLKLKRATKSEPKLSKKKGLIHSSLENLPQSVTNVLLPKHARQRSSPDNLLYKSPPTPDGSPKKNTVSRGSSFGTSDAYDTPSSQTPPPFSIHPQGANADDPSNEDYDDVGDKVLLIPPQASAVRASPMEGRPLPPLPHIQAYGTPPESMRDGATRVAPHSILCADDDEPNGSDTEMTALFYAITEIYRHAQEKEKAQLKKWANEITSTFLWDSAPLEIGGVCKSYLEDIDQTLNDDREENQLKQIFVKTRSIAQDKINKQLADFRAARLSGLAGMYSGQPGWSNAVTDSAQLDSQHAENNLAETLKTMIDLRDAVEAKKIPYDKNMWDEKKSTFVSALATVLKHFSSKSDFQKEIQRSDPKLIERVPTFVAKEKGRSLNKFFPPKSTKKTIKGHQLVMQHFSSPTDCNECLNIIGGVGDQGYQCINCKINIHRSCENSLEFCTEQQTKKDKVKRKSGLIDNLSRNISRRPTNISQNTPRVSNRNSQDFSEDSPMGHDETSDRLLPNRTDCDDMDDRETGAEKRTSAGGKRSESFRQRREVKPQYRKRSDPNLPRSKSDFEGDDNLNHSGSSSTSSLSASVGSPFRTSQEGVTASNGQTGAQSNVHGLDDDSDLDYDPENFRIPELPTATDEEKKRQRVIGELFHTERTHVRTLKILDRLFYQPLKNHYPCPLPYDLLGVLLENVSQLLEIHGELNQKMKLRLRQEEVVGDIGEMMCSFFEGRDGSRLKEAVSTFYRHLREVTDRIKNCRRKDQRLVVLFNESENHPLCRRLKFNDITATVFQRLTKYPLLLENAAKCSPPNSIERENLTRSVELSKNVLAAVNEEMALTEKVDDIQRRLEISLNEVPNEAVHQNIVVRLKSLRLTSHRFIYEGVVTWSLNRQKSIDIQLLLLDDKLVLLQKQDEKFLLKFHSVRDTKQMYSPLVTLESDTQTRNVDREDTAFILLSTQGRHPFYKFAARTPEERDLWVTNITQMLREVVRQSERRDRAPLLPQPSDEPNEPSEIEAQPEAPDEPQTADDVHIEGRVYEITDGPGELVDFSEVTVVPTASVETAQPVLTFIERLRRIRDEYRALVSEMRNIPPDDYDYVVDMCHESTDEKDLFLLAAAHIDEELAWLTDCATDEEVGQPRGSLYTRWLAIQHKMGVALPRFAAECTTGAESARSSSRPASFVSITSDDLVLTTVAEAAPPRTTSPVQAPPLTTATSTIAEQDTNTTPGNDDKESASSKDASCTEAFGSQEGASPGTTTATVLPVHDPVGPELYI